MIKTSKPRVLDLRFLGPETKDMMRRGVVEVEYGGVMELCRCGELKVYDRDAGRYVCQHCLQGVGRPWRRRLDA